MTDRELLFAGIMLISVFVSAISQVLLKKAAMREWDSPIKEYLNPWVISAYALFFITTLVTVLAYAGIPLSLGPVLEATSYLYITFFGVVIFKEKIGWQKALALALIVGGIIVFAFFG